VRNESRKRIKVKVKSQCREKEGNMGKDGKVKGTGKEYGRKDRSRYRKGR
jgi:hypothetical protein